MSVARRYIQGLPMDVTVDEVVAHFAKCGVIAPDPVTQQPRVKLYTDEVPPSTLYPPHPPQSESPSVTLPR